MLSDYGALEQIPIQIASVRNVIEKGFIYRAQPGNVLGIGNLQSVKGFNEAVQFRVHRGKPASRSHPLRHRSSDREFHDMPFRADTVALRPWLCIREPETRDRSRHFANGG